MVSLDSKTQCHGSQLLQLSPDLVWSPHVINGETFFHVEQPSQSRFFQLGHSETVFVSLLDGSTTVDQALALVAQQDQCEPLPEEKAQQVVQWLLREQLATDVAGADGLDDNGHRPDSRRGKLNLSNPFWQTVPLGNPGKLIESTYAFVRWMLHPAATLFVLLAILVAGCTVLLNVSQIFESALGILSPSNWGWMMVTWIGLKVIHEFAHAVVCHHFGGKVERAGVAFVLFAPLAFVDVTSSWRFESRWRRIGVALAGMYAELAVASVCVFIWCSTTNELVAQHLVNAIVMASVSTLLFNANALMRFDGYFVLSDLAQVPNLYEKGQKSLRRTTRKVFYGPRGSGTCTDARYSWFVRVYGVAAAIWRVVICIGLAIAASMMFGGFGLLLAVAGVTGWYIRPLLKVIPAYLGAICTRPAVAFRFAVLTFLASGTLALVWFVTPNPFPAACPCIVDWRESSKVRAEADGFVSTILVADGETVVVGQPLMHIENRQLEIELKQLRIELEQSLARGRAAVDWGSPAEVQVERETQKAISARIDETARKVEGLAIVAPVAGKVFAMKDFQQVGTFVSPGDLLFVVGDESDRELRLLINSSTMNSIDSLCGSQVSVLLGTRHRVPATVSRTEYAAGSTVQHPALASLNGGPVPVRETGDDNSLELYQPHFRATATPPPAFARQILVGERGTILLQPASETLGKFLFRTCTDWLATSIDRARPQY